jgi:hypothetical protein
MTLIIQKPTGAKLVLAQGQPVPNDPNFAFNSLLLHGDGANGSTVITDSSGSPKTVTAFGNAQISTAQSKFGGASIAFDGNGDRLDCSTNLGLANFPASGQLGTIEGWFYFISVPQTRSCIAGVWSGPSPFFGWTLEITPAGNVVMATGGGILTITLSSAISFNVWTFLALVNTGSQLRVYKDGVQVGSLNNYSPTLSPDVFRIGARSLGDLAVNGYIDDFRVTTGVARYTSNFTPPTLPFPDF